MKRNTQNYSLAIIIPVIICFFANCSKELKQPALGGLSEETLATKEGVKKLLVGTYAALNGQGGDGIALGGGDPYAAAPDNWIFGTIAGGEAHKGSEGGDQSGIDGIAKFITDASNGFFDTKWKAVYEGVTRANATIRLLNEATDINDDDRKNILAQARFLRGHYYFELKKLYGNIPWIDENTTDYNQPNNVDIWPKIEEDFNFAFNNINSTQEDVGFANKWAAGSYLAKTYLYEKKYAEAQKLFEQVINNGTTASGEPYDLLPQYEHNFMPQYENGPESVFAIQMVANDGTNTIANANQGGMLNFPYNGPFSCCGFYQPTIDLANSFRTTNTGLPYINSYNDHPIKNDQGITSAKPFTTDTDPLDPRLDWTVGRRGIPYLDWGLHPGQDWIRLQSYAGPYSSKKNIYWQATQNVYSDQSSWAPGTAINVLIIRFADVLLMAAESEAQQGNLEKAQAYVNRVRSRAANPEGWLYTYKNTSSPMSGFSNKAAANYKIQPYSTGTFVNIGKEAALQAIYFERKLELAMEGHRFFDLVRWGQAESTINAFFNYESKFTTDIKGGKYQSSKNDLFPIPQRQIDLSNAAGNKILQQNSGY
ncbi:Starch-binding associating with outer membrane [bacterium A37T11]|nr:Starch-binding associating with outer membrane [bacterium A37T11]